MNIKTTFFFTAILLQSGILFGQNGWKALTSNTTNDLRVLAFSTKSSGLIRGTHGTLLSTSDFGEHWNASSDKNMFVNSLCSPAPHTYYTNGSSGTIMKSINDGATWDTIQLAPQEPGGFSYIAFPSPEIGYAGGDNDFIVTTNGGKNWYKRKIGCNLETIYGMSFVSPSSGYVLHVKGLPSVGNIQDTANVPGHCYDIVAAGAAIYSLFFPSIATGYVCGANGAIYKTTDSAKTWSIQNNGISTGTTLSSLYFSNDTEGYVCGSGGAIYYTSDGGKNWKQQPTGITQGLAYIYFTGKDTGFVVGGGGTILKTTNGGFSAIQPEGQQMQMAKIFPNPARNILNIQLTNTIPNLNISVVVCNSLGQVVFESKNISQDMLQIDLSPYPIGTYFYTTTGHNNNQDFYQKGIIEVVR